VAISAVTGEGVRALVAAISAQLEGERQVETIELGFDDGRRRAWLHEQGIVESERQGEDGISVTVRWTPRQAARFDGLT
jgi:GTP-binding protein HflX